MQQNRAKIIGLTGGIATGKSTASNIIKELGYLVIDADKIARDIVEIGEPAYKEIVNNFGKDIVFQDGNLNRKKLGYIVFNNDKKRETLNRITHPHIKKAIKKSIDKNIEKNIIFVDIPLLIEGIDSYDQYGIYFDEIWLVYIDEESQINRLMKRDSIKRDEAINKIKAQMPIEEKVKYATRIIDNRGDISYLYKQLRDIIKEVI